MWASTSGLSRSSALARTSADSGASAYWAAPVSSAEVEISTATSSVGAAVFSSLTAFAWMFCWPGLFLNAPVGGVALCPERGGRVCTLVRHPGRVGLAFQRDIGPVSGAGVDARVLGADPAEQALEVVAKPAEEAAILLVLELFSRSASLLGGGSAVGMRCRLQRTGSAPVTPSPICASAGTGMWSGGVGLFDRAAGLGLQHRRILGLALLLALQLAVELAAEHRLGRRHRRRVRGDEAGRRLVGRAFERQHSTFAAFSTGGAGGPAESAAASSAAAAAARASRARPRYPRPSRYRARLRHPPADPPPR